MFKVTIVVMQVVTFINCNRVVVIWSEIQKTLLQLRSFKFMMPHIFTMTASSQSIVKVNTSSCNLSALVTDEPISRVENCSEIHQ